MDGVWKIPLHVLPAALRLFGPGFLTHPGEGPVVGVVGWLRRAEVDRSVVLSIVACGWQFLAAPVTLLLIARFMSPTMQGFYYTFASLLALQSFVELGFSSVIVNITRARNRS
jgi:hypothetical protein